jgi:hypothetical protein
LAQIELEFQPIWASIERESVSNPHESGSIRAVSLLNSAQSAFDPLPIDPVIGLAFNFLRASTLKIALGLGFKLPDYQITHLPIFRDPPSPPCVYPIPRHSHPMPPHCHPRRVASLTPISSHATPFHV